MNLVLDEAEEVSMKRKARKPIGVQFAADLLKELLFRTASCLGFQPR